MQRMLTKSTQDTETVELPAKYTALKYITEAWEEALYDGVEPDGLAMAAIFAALSDMTSAYGEEPVAKMCENLPKRVRNGEFTIISDKQ